MKINIITIFLFIFTACQSVASNRLDSTQYKSLKRIINQSCFASHNGSFLTNVRTSTTPSFSWEGQWSQDYSQLNTQLLDPTGRQIELNPLSAMITKFGPTGVRRMMCGETAFVSTLQLDGHKIVVRSVTKIVEQSAQYTLIESTSEFYYGLFAMKKNKNIFFWRGRVQNGAISPEFIRFGADDEFLTLDFIDYE